jgi:hypothetical protein
MSGLLKEAMEQAANLPESDQDQIGRDLLSHVEKLRRLRAEIDRGLRSLDEDKGTPLDIEEFVRKRHGGK